MKNNSTLISSTIGFAIIFTAILATVLFLSNRDRINEDNQNSTTNETVITTTIDEEQTTDENINETVDQIENALDDLNSEDDFGDFEEVEFVGE